MHLLRSALALSASSLLILLASSCGELLDELDGNVSGCDFREEGKTEQRCQDRTGGIAGDVGLAPFEQLCTASKGKVRKGGCEESGRVGGCELQAGDNGGARVVDWYYDPMTEDAVRQACRSFPFIAP